MNWRLAHSGGIEQRVARRARVLLAMARPQTLVQALAERVEMSPTVSGISAAAMKSGGSQRCGMHLAAADQASFPPLQRVQVERLACCEPLGLGLHLTHWSSRSLAEVATATDLVPHIGHSTVALILRHADLQPHRCRYWKTPTFDEAFVERAAPVLWCYEHVEWLAQREEFILCWDEKPNLQALERKPSQPMRPGQIERQEFEYVRHGTVNFGSALVVHDGTMRGWHLDKNDSQHLCPALAELFAGFKGARRLHLIWDGGSSHESDYTRQFLRHYRSWVRVLPTPPHASWLNQGELLLRAFAARFLQRGVWESPAQLIEHLLEATDEYNRLFAHPFTWSWTRRDMRRLVAQKNHGLPSKTCRTVH